MGVLVQVEALLYCVATVSSIEPLLRRVPPTGVQLMGTLEELPEVIGTAAYLSTSIVGQWHCRERINPMSNPARTIQLFLIDGDPKHRIKATLSNWTGLVYSVPRICLDWKPVRLDLDRTGVYLLFGTNSDTGSDQVYIGQARERANGKGMLGRVVEHIGEEKLDYFNHVMAITTQNDSFGPTEISYLENAFYQMAVAAGRYTVTNSNNPSPGKVTEEKEAELDEFINYVKVVVGSLGYKVFEPVDDGEARPDRNRLGHNDGVLVIDYKRLLAAGRQSSDGFVVLAGSEVDPVLTASCPASVVNYREKYADAIGEDNKTTRNLLFSSPSAAAGFVAGSSMNGRDRWRYADGRALGAVENAEAEAVVKAIEEAARSIAIQPENAEV